MPERSRLLVDIALAGSAASAAQDRQFSSRVVRFGEIESAEARYPRPSRAFTSPLADVGFGLVVAKHLRLGISQSRTTYKDAVSLEATVPHPLFLTAPASDAGMSVELKRREGATHVFVAIVPFRTSRMELGVQAGPSFFRYSAEMVRTIEYDQTFDVVTPANSLVITGAAIDEVRGSDVGAHAGLDFTWFLTGRIGVGARVRFSQGTVTIGHEPLSGVEQRIRVGSTLIVAGLRLRFGGQP